MAGTALLSDMFVGAVTVGERGQVVIPAQARERLRIAPGDKLLAFMGPLGLMLMRIETALEHSRAIEQLAAATQDLGEDRQDE